MAHKSKQPKRPERDLAQIVSEIAVYPPEAYEFVQLGLQWTVERVHAATPEEESHHVSGQQLALGMRDYAWQRWGLMARTVLSRWNITSTQDFGKIVYALIEAGVLSKTESDRIEHFKNVYDFRSLDTDYIPAPPEPAAPAVPIPDKAK